MAAHRHRRKRSVRDSEFADYYDEEPIRSSRSDSAMAGRLTSPVKHLLVLGGISLVFLAAIWLVAGKGMLEKTLQTLAAPSGITWLGLTLSVYFCLLKRLALPAVLSLVSWIVLTLAGNTLVGNWMAHSLEQDYYEFDEATMPKMDALLVLGGGTNLGPNGKPQAGFAGDRLLVAARLFRQGKIGLLVCSGSDLIPPPEGGPSIAQSTAKLLTDLGVDRDRILMIGGKNTLEEMQAFDRWLAEQSNRNLKVAVLTSAWHMNRALRLADTVGVNATAVPANFMSTRYQPGPGLLVPTAHNLMRTTLVIKEYLAGTVGR